LQSKTDIEIIKAIKKQEKGENEISPLFYCNTQQKQADHVITIYSIKIEETMKNFFIPAVVALMVVGATLTGCNCQDDIKDDTAFAASVTASTVPQEKNAFVELFTGVKSEQSAEGHRILNGLMVTHPGRIFCMNIHTGVYADNTYTTDFGNELLRQADINAFPAGTVNRQVFETYAMDTVNQGTAIPIRYIANACDLVMAQSAPANLDAKAEINAQTRELKVAVAIYYTESETDTLISTHKLNVALLEDSIWGEQLGGSTLNPTQYDFNNAKYCHSNMLRHLVTDQWGVDIVPETGKQIRRVFVYTIPEQISGVDVNLDHLKIVVFLAKGKQNVINACAAPIKIN
jgi:hypothetical protein